MPAADGALQRPSLPFQLVVFDMDDTLFPEIDYVRSGFGVVAQHIAASVGLADQDVLVRMWRHFEVDRRTVFDAVLADLGLADRLSVPTLVELYRAHLPRIQLREGAAEVLTSLRAAGLHLGVVTDGPLVMQQRKAEALDLASHIDRIVFTGGLPPGCAKPSPVAFKRLMDEFAVPPGRCMYVADNPRKDFLGPRQLGWLAVQFMVPGGIYCGETAPPGGQPHMQIRDLREILPLCLPGC